MKGLLLFKKRSFDLILINGRMEAGSEIPNSVLDNFLPLVSKQYRDPDGRAIIFVEKDTLFSSLVAVNLTVSRWTLGNDYSRSYQNFFAWFLPSVNGMIYRLI